MKEYSDRLSVRLKKLKLQNFRGFRDIELALETEKNVTVLIADNGLGKTSLLDATAEFLRFFRYEAIYSAHEKQAVFKGEFNPIYDVTNDTLTSIGQAVLEIEYPFIAVELFEWIDGCVRWLDEYEVPGVRARLIFDDEESSYAFLITPERATEGSEEKEIVYLLPDELRQLIVKIQEKNEGVDLFSLLDAELQNHANAELEIAERVNGQWELSKSFKPTSYASTHRGEIELKFVPNPADPKGNRFFNEEIIYNDKGEISVRQDYFSSVDDFKKAFDDLHDRLNLNNEILVKARRIKYLSMINKYENWLTKRKNKKNNSKSCFVRHYIKKITVLIF